MPMFRIKACTSFQLSVLYSAANWIWVKGLIINTLIIACTQIQFAALWRKAAAEMFWSLSVQIEELYWASNIEEL